MTKSVCIIDDDELTRAQMARMLEIDGFAVLEAEDAGSGLSLVATARPDVVLVDLIMPDKDGLETIAEIRRTWPDIQIVAISGGGRVGPSIYLDLAQKLGASACLTKPLVMAAFRQAIGLAHEGEAYGAGSPATSS